MSDSTPEHVNEVAPILPVRDIERALDHYRALGFEGHPYDGGEEEGEPATYAFMRLGADNIHLTRVEDLDPEASTSGCYLYVEDADELHAIWSDADVEGRFTEPEDTPYGLREFAHIDPDGNLLRVGSPSSDA